MTRKLHHLFLLLLAGFVAAGSTAMAAGDNYAETIGLFRKAGESGKFFGKSYGYAVFPTVGKGGIGIGGAYGKGRVYRGSGWVGEVSLAQVSVGFQLGGQAYSEIIFFENKATFDDFTSGNFEFGADIGAVAITAGANASVSSAGGASAGASATNQEAATAGGYHHGVAVFTIAKGGLMYQATVAGQKFSYKARGK
jgi:lipid-binding SYLF domain-containing protein